MNPLAPVLAALLPCAIVLAEHYAPWRRWLGCDLPRLAAYTLGALGFMAPATVAALYATTVVEAIILFWVALASAGAGTFAAWGIDWQNERQHRKADELDRALYGK